MKEGIKKARKLMSAYHEKISKGEKVEECIRWCKGGIEQLEKTLRGKGSDGLTNMVLMRRQSF